MDEEPAMDEAANVSTWNARAMREGGGEDEDLSSRGRDLSSTARCHRLPPLPPSAAAALQPSPLSNHVRCGAVLPSSTLGDLKVLVFQVKQRSAW